MDAGAYGSVTALRYTGRRINVPIPDGGVADDEVYDDIVGHIAEHRGRGGVYVHCWGGVGRTGTGVGCLLADEGLGHDAIATKLTELRAGTRKAHRACPENDGQLDVIRRRTARSRSNRPS